MKVAEIMTRRVQSCRSTQTLAEVMRWMWERDLGAIPVVNDDGQPIAMVTDRDIAVAAYTQGRPLHEIMVQSAMSRELHTAHVDDSVSAAERTMRLHQLHRLPVVDESTRMVGMLSLNDLARAQARSSLTPGADPFPCDVARTLAIVARPRSGASDPVPSERTPDPSLVRRASIRELARNPSDRARSLPAPARATSHGKG